MILNLNSGGARNNLIEKDLSLQTDHHFSISGGVKNYLVLSDIDLSTGILNSVVMFCPTEQTSRFNNGAFVDLFWCTSQYSTEFVTICGRAFYKMNDLIGSSIPIYPTDASEFIYDHTNKTLKIFIPTSSDLYIQSGFVYRFAIW